ncbi:hypothetical protein AAZX31_16G111600 [Glycine max]
MKPDLVVQFRDRANHRKTNQISFGIELSTSTINLSPSTIIFVFCYRITIPSDQGNRTRIKQCFLCSGWRGQGASEKRKRKTKEERKREKKLKYKQYLTEPSTFLMEIEKK